MPLVCDDWGMPISWSDAVRDLDDPSRLARYRRALDQISELHLLITSFTKAVQDSGKWPIATSDDNKKYPDDLRTRGLFQARQVRVSPDGTWVLEDPGEHKRFLLVVEASGEPRAFNMEKGDALLASRDFDTVMDSMERTKDWVPRELVAYLRTHDIPIPHD